MQIKRIMILGPTASGKTDLSIKLAQEIDGEIISVDSRQCYKEIDIGTAKPRQEHLAGIPHYNLSVLSLTHEDSVADFLLRAEEWTEDILKKDNYVIYTGGSTLHLQGLLFPLDDLPSSDPDNIRILNKIADNEGLDKLYDELKSVDPVYAEKMDGLNRQRIIRALTVWQQTGKPFSSYHRQSQTAPPGDMIVFGLQWPRKMLHERINHRVDTMIDDGLVDEVRELLRQGYSSDLQSLQSVGYREVMSMLRGDCTFEEMVKDIKTRTRRYAKRQITWFRRWPFIHWMNCNSISTVHMLDFIKHELAAKRNKG